MKNQTIIIVILVTVVMAGAGFFGGMQYQKMQRTSFSANGVNPQGRRFGMNGQNGGAAVRGSVLNSDANSITVKLADGSSKIVLLSGTTTITEATMAARTALQTGTQVMAIGTTNSDGSVTATTIQLNPRTN